MVVLRLLSDMIGDIINEEKNDCVDDLTNAWELMIDNAWHEDVSAKVSCDDSNCCSKFSISSSGPIGDRYPDAMTTYEQLEDNVNDKPSYSSVNHFLFYHVDVPHHFQGWTISSVLNTLGDITKEGNTACAESTEGNWEFVDENQEWSIDETIVFNCIKTCCSKLSITSSGAAAVNFPELMGTYEISGEENGKPSYQGPIDKALLRYVDDIPHRWSGWGVGEGGGKISSDEDPDCPSETEQTWDVFVGNAWIRDETLVLNCMF